MIPLIKPDIQFSEVSEDIEKILNSGQLTSGAYVRRFEEEFAEYVGTRYAVTTTSATTALHMSLVVLGVGVGDEVLVSDFSFPASGNAIVQCGAKPVFVDCLPDRFDLDWEDAKAKITPKTRGIMIVHPFGQPVPLADINQFKSETKLWVLEDAACAAGAYSDGVMCGAMGDMACFSFHPRKILTTGEGGMITTNDETLYQKLSVLRSHGGRRSTVGLEFVENGFNYRMSEIQAALGLSQLSRMDQILGERQRIADIYIEELSEKGVISIPLSGTSNECSFQSFVVLLPDTFNQAQLISKLWEKGIESTLGTYAMHSQPSFKSIGYSPGDLPNSYRAQVKSLTLPLVKGMTRNEIDRIVAALI